MGLLEMNWLSFALPAGVQTLLVLRLTSTGLVKRYPAFAAWIVVSALSNGILAVFSQSHRDYRSAWIATQAVSVLALFGALVELSNRILEHYPGLRRVSASTLFGVLVAAAVVAAAAESIEKPVRLVIMLITGWTAAAGVYVMLLVALATYLDPRRRLNVVIHENAFLAHCLVVVGAFLVISTLPSLSGAARLVGVMGGVLFPLWWMRMNAAGEVDRRPQGRRRTSDVSLAETEATIDRLERMVTRSGG